MSLLKRRPLRRSSRRGQAGFTAAEAIMTVSIVAILATVAAPIMIRMNNFWRQTTARNEIERDVRSSLETVNRWLRQAKRSTVVIDQVAGQPPFSRITFTPEKGGTMQFYQAGDKLYMKLSSNTITTTMLSNRLGFIAFTYPKTFDVSIVSVAVTMQAPTYLGGKKALQLSVQKVRIMN